MVRTKVAIIGSGNIGTDLMVKLLRRSRYLEPAAVVGIDPHSDGLKRAAALDVPTTHEGVEGLLRLPGFDEIDIVFDATSAKAHEHNHARLAPLGKRVIDLTPAAIGPFVVPAVNLCDHLDAPNVNMAAVFDGRVGAIGAGDDLHSRTRQLLADRGAATASCTRRPCTAFRRYWRPETHSSPSTSSRTPFSEEALENNVVTDETGIYAVTSRRMLELVWTGSHLSNAENDGGWEATGPAAGVESVAAESK
ncbi:hypothetical protein [Nocardia sp. NPDC059228]|uniref:hypothetical protein n=1 Tax=Nocardia sp. NPDC059228 TaxID=3346777 RepID=UPI0036C7B0A8